MTFNEYTDGWFDGLADWAKRHPEDSLSMLRIASMSPTKSNVVALAKFASKQPATYPINLVVFGNLLIHCKSVIDKEFRKEFRFSFGGKAAKRFQDMSKVSAASELFSLVRQAINYEKVLS